MSRTPRTIGLPCDGRVCGGHRLHEITVTRHPDGRVTRDVVCTACGESEPFGLHCPRCGDVRFKVVRTRHRAGPVSTVRVKKCRCCGHRLRTREIVESNTA